MSIKEIIEILKIAKAEIEWNYPLDYQIAFDEAIKLLEKQVAKKPIPFIDDSGDIPFKSWKCPVCGSDYIGDAGCGDCLQALYWESEDE